MNIFKRIFDAADAAISALYAKRDMSDEGAWPVLADENGNLRVNMTVGTVSLSSTASTITNAASNPVNVALTETRVTAHISPTASVVSVHISPAGSLATVSLTSTIVTSHISPSASAVTISNTVAVPVSLSETRVTAHISPSASTVTAHISPSASAVTIANAVANPANVSLTNTQVSVSNAAGVFNVNIRTATLGTVTTSLSSTIVTAHFSPSASAVTASLSQTRVSCTIITGQNGVDGNAGAVSAATQRVVMANDTGRTLTGATGSISATFNTIFTPTNRAKIYAFSFTTTSASEVTVLICDGTFANAKEKWRVTLMAPSGSMAGANLAVPPPAFICASRSTSAITISLSTAVLVHYSLSLYDEA